MNQEDVLPMLARIGAIKQGHYALATKNKSGDWMHSGTYIDKRELSNGKHEEEMSGVCFLFAQKLFSYGVRVVVGPAEGGKPFAKQTAQHLARIAGRKISCVYAEKAEGGGFFIAQEDVQCLFDEIVGLTEDISSTGKSAKDAVKAIRDVGGKVVAVCTVCNRGGVTAQAIGVPAFHALSSMNVQVWPYPCPLCRQNVPVNTDVGHGKQFLEWKNAQSS